ncbi:hypothetical protein AB4043_18495 [Terriglobus sp. YAF25]|uniref:hypothetical protein n=1 Tax=Terriglobus sp. YAF25 TaxID=3233080 RepID=UPI003F9A9040
MKLLATFFLALFTVASMRAEGPEQASPAQRTGGGLDPAVLLNPTPDSWPTYNGDYSGRRFSTCISPYPTMYGRLMRGQASHCGITPGHPRAASTWEIEALASRVIPCISKRRTATWSR